MATSGEIKTLRKKILTKPKGQAIQRLSPERALHSFQRSSGPVVREVEREEITPNDRSIFFNSEFQEEVRGINKWLR